MPTGMRTTLMARSSIRWTPSTTTGIYQGRGRCSFPINQKASRKLVWSASRKYMDVCLGYPGSAGPDTLEHSQGQDRVRRSKGVPGQRLRCNCFSNRHPQQHRSLSKDASVCINPSVLRLRVRALPRPEQHDPSPGQCPGL